MKIDIVKYRRSLRKKERMVKMFFSAPVWALNYQPPFDKIIERLAGWGAKGIELIGMTEQTFTDYYTDSEIAKLNAIIEDRGLILSNFNYAANDLASEVPALREKSIDIFNKAAETAARLHAKHITTVAPYPFSFNNELIFMKQLPLCQTYAFDADLSRDWDANFAVYVEGIEHCCKIAKQYGLDVLIEPHPYRYVNSAASMLYFMSFVQADNLGFNFDTGHMFASGDMPQCSVYQLKNRIKHFHIGDNDTYTNAHWRPGMGKIEWKSFMKALKDIGYDYALSMELSDVPGFASRTSPGTDAFGEQFRLSCNYLRELGEEVGITFI